MSNNDRTHNVTKQQVKKHDYDNKIRTAAKVINEEKIMYGTYGEQPSHTAIIARIVPKV